MTDREEPEIRDKAKKQYLQDTTERYALKSIAYVLFGGFIDFSQSHGLIVDVMVRVNRKSLSKNGLDTTQVHNTRDWNNIETWARGIAIKGLKGSNIFSIFQLVNYKPAANPVRILKIEI
jgi:hypothetical protein